ncbi:MAG: siphovirus ReqiPepy6 Gp37-like family protein [Clostridia bacterium]|nr:siphovirus ReqiPepy6 Gp37-like family protein [Clostridia bacterium]
MRAFRILTPDFEPLGEIAGYTSFSLIRRHFGVGEFELFLPARGPGAADIGVDTLLMPVGAPEKTVIVESLLYEEAKAGLTLRGCTLDGLVKRRLAVPPRVSEKTFGWDRVPNPGDPDVPAETVLKHFARNNLAEPAGLNRAIPNLVIAPDLGRGDPMRGQARFEALDVLLKDLGEFADMGWHIVPDHQQKLLVFDVAPGRDVHAMVSLDMGNAGEMKYMLDAASMRNIAYVGGQGEDERRLILAFGDADPGRVRREVWVEGGSLELPDEMERAGNRKLSQTETKITIQGAVLQHGAFQYGRDFDLGDRVTLKTHMGRLEARAVEVRETYARDRPVQLDITFGDAPVTVTGMIGDLQNTVVR